jgi:hypothetical protein
MDISPSAGYQKIYLVYLKKNSKETRERCITIGSLILSLNAVGEMASEAAAGGGLGLVGCPQGLKLAVDCRAQLICQYLNLPPKNPAGEAPEAPGEEGGAESPLLATPGKRDGRETAGKLKSYINISTPEATRGRTSRSKFPGKQDQDLLSKGIYTEQESSYNGDQDLQEQRIFTINQETQRLINDLEDMEPKQDETQ